MRDISFSIIIPVYNVERYLKTCLDHVLMQITASDEVILINDGSLDSSREICLNYKKTYRNIIFIDRKNAGLGKTRNVGLMKASKEYILFLDSDDYWGDNTIGTIKCELLKNRLDVLYFDAEQVFEDAIVKTENLYDRKGKVSEEIITGRLFFEKYFPDGYIVQACMAAYRRKFLLENDIFFQEGVYYEDNIFSFKVAMNAEKVKHISRQLYIRRIHSNSITSSVVDYKKVNDYSKVVMLIWEYIGNIWSGLDNRSGSKVIEFAEGLLYTFQQYCKRSATSMELLSQLKNQVIYEYFLLLHKYTDEKRIVRIFRARNIFKGEQLEELPVINSCQMEFYRQQYKEIIMKKIEKLSLFDTNFRLGIYGTGKQAEGLTKFLKENAISTNAILYIDSNVQTGTRQFMGCEVWNIRDIGNYVDKVIISSKLYEKEMFEMAKKFLRPDVVLVSLYEEEKEEIQWSILSE